MEEDDPGPGSCECSVPIAVGTSAEEVSGRLVGEIGVAQSSSEPVSCVSPTL